MIRALYGGTFDPFHSGHLAIIEQLFAGNHCRHLHVVPAGQAPGKDKPIVSAAHRLAMVEAGLTLLPADMRRRIEVETMETRREGPTYTVDTLEILVRQYPHDTWRLVLGADAWAGHAIWRRPERILELATPLVFAREDQIPAQDSAEGDPAIHVRDFAVPISATRIRDVLHGSQDALSMLPSPVLTYIRKHGLYQQEAD
jgi:nicotinate-nucleotide adenylyltransferase